MTYRVKITNGNREYFHGQEFADQWPEGNAPIDHWTREQAETVAADARTRLGRGSEVVEFADGVEVAKEPQGSLFAA